ncbi:MAG: lipopolysaccharide heptosyltransferase I [Ramlibacter sp.]|nr:lipopolysaccharide heptosyltransferase I [Ramlibacter sp.]
MKILLVKLSSLGDVVHAMPAVQDIRAALPGAQIDWVVERGFAPLVARCEGVRRVIPCELRRWRKSPFAADTRAQWRAFKAELQAEAYDAIIDLQGLSKSALVSWLARRATGGQRYALANQTEGSGYEAPTRWVADVAVHIAPHIHAVARSRELCARALGYAEPDSMHFGLLARASRPLGAMESEADAASPQGCVALVHGTSRDDKCWPEDHWLALGRRLVQAGWALGLPHGSAAEHQRSERLAAQLGPQARVWPAMDLGALTDRLAACAGVIGVDSGLSHIAVALDLPHVQLYNFDTAWRTGPQGRARQRSLFDQPVPLVDAVWQAWCEVAA